MGYRCHFPGPIRRIVAARATDTASRSVVLPGSRVHRNVLILDGTNVLARSFTGSSGSSGSKERVRPEHVFRLWTEYLASSVSADVVVGVFDSPRNRGKSESALYPFRSYLESRPGSMMVTSSPGQEADGVIVNVAQRLAALSPSYASTTRTWIASGDSDLQACLSTGTSWVEILPYPTKASPGGLVVHELGDFRWGAYFAPQDYGAFLALRGKEAVKGVGVSEKTAAKLVKAFGTVEKMLEAGRGDDGLKSWDVGVRRVLEGVAGRERLARNAALFGFLGGTEGDVVADAVVRFVVASCGAEPGGELKRDDDGQYHHPMFEVHFDRIRAGAEEMMRDCDFRVAWKVVLDGGWYVDAVINERVCVVFVDVEGAEDVDGFVISDVIMYVERSLNGDLGTLDPFKLRKRSGMARYLALLKSCPWDVLLLPAAVAPVR